MISFKKTLALIASLGFVCLAASLPSVASGSPSTASLMEKALSGDQALHKSGQSSGLGDLTDTYEGVLNQGAGPNPRAIGAGNIPGARDASSSRATHRKKRKRKMPISLALSTTRYFVKQLYLETLDEVSWDDYGAGDCRRMSRPSVRCLYYLADDIYDEYDYSYLDTMICGGYTYTYFNWQNKPKFKSPESQCFLESEL